MKMGRLYELHQCFLPHASSACTLHRLQVHKQFITLKILNDDAEVD
jgi:hypothetical protein